MRITYDCSTCHASLDAFGDSFAELQRALDAVSIDGRLYCTTCLPPLGLWLLEASAPPGDDYDVYAGHLVCARTGAAARALCPAGDEGSDYWRDPARSTCRRLADAGPDQAVGVLLSSFNAG